MRRDDHSWIRALILTAACWGGACATPPAPPQETQLARALSPPERRGPPTPLPEPARALLKAGMANHARDMAELVSAIMILDYPRIASEADRIAGDIRLSRPVTLDATEVNSALPETFFQHQDALRMQARALAEDARSLDAYRVAADYGHLSESCVRCHSEFRPSR